MGQDLSAVQVENQQLRDELAAFRTRFQNVIEMNLDGILVVSEDRGEVLYLNPAAEKMLGRDKDALLGTVIGFPIQGPEKSELDILRPDGSTLVAELNVGQMVWNNTPALLASLRDITRRVRTEQELRWSEERFRRAIENAPFPMMIHAEDGEVLNVNQVWQDLTGYGSEEISTIQDWTEKAYGEQKKLVREEIDRLYHQDQRIREGQYLISTRGGKELIWDFSSAPLGELPDGRRTVVSMAQDVTSQVRAEEQRDTTMSALRGREQEYARLSNEFEAILDHIPALIFYKDTRNQFVRVNKYLAEAHQLPKEEMQGRPVADFYPEADQYWKHDLEVIQSGEPKLNIIEPWQVDDEHRWVSTSKIPFQNQEGETIGIIGISLDVTELKRTQEALQWQLQINQAVADVARAVVGGATIDEISNLVLDHTKDLTGSRFGYVGYIEPETGHLVSPTLTRDVWDVCQVDDKDVVFEKFGGLWGWVLENKKAVLINEPELDQRSTGIPEGHIPIESFMSSPALIGDELMGQIALANASEDYLEKDLKFVKRMANIYSLAVRHTRSQAELQLYADQLEEMVQERTQELEDAQQKLVRQERLAVLGQLAGGVGHELRNPLGVMSNAIYYLKLLQPEINGKIEEYHQILDQEIKKAEKIVSDLMDFARLEQPKQQQVGVEEIVDQVMSTNPPPDSIHAAVEIPDSLPDVRVDPGHFRQILMNFVVNAYQAMPEGGNLTLTAAVENQQVKISVIDTGDGIKKEHRKDIFEPLYTTKARGIGLGLAISERLALGNQGRIEFETQVGKGTSFELYLPSWKSVE